ncbi:hypothetical protein CBR_g50893 [Chara braunii]|uniref:Integrase catalytic domain-containing protein n=1 Tax=Chara braunii TaxID=69332 RepID=A0A388M7N0_CHABU|nr:hypothetical protein CBR_g50893 [Chara braunii]|eukprot:GBG90550.1 hypothetical protein CBR_g50893 [Chara braunii]
MLCFSDLAVLAGAWNRSRDEFDDELRVLCEKLELRKQEYARECRELGGRSARVEGILLRIGGVDDPHLEGRVPKTRMGGSPTARGNRAAKCDELAIKAAEEEEMERAITAITATIKDSPLTTRGAGANASERDQYTAFAPLASTYWVEHISTVFRHAIWKMETFNHITPISIRALQFLGNVTDAQVKECRAQVLKGKLKFSGRVPPLDPQDLKFPPMHALDPDKCGKTSSGMWQKAIRQQDRLDLRNLKKIWSVGRPYLKCKCKKDRNEDCGDTALWFDHALWYLLAHPHILFPDMSSIKIRTSMLISYLRTTWRDGVLAAISLHFLRDLMMGYVRELERDTTLDTESLLKEDRLWNYPIPALLARIMLPTRIAEKPTRFPLSSLRAAARKRGGGAQIRGQTTFNFRRMAPAFMTHMAVTLECTIATLHTKITWEEFEKKWKTRFMVNNDKHHALNKIFRMFQGQQPSREWLTEWRRLVATPELNLPFDTIRAEFFARSCDGLTIALGSEFQYETFDDMISKARELIQVPPPSTDGGVVVVDLRNYLAKIDREHATQCHGVSEDIVSDRDTRFMSAFWTALMVESDTNTKPSFARHPQMDGQTERAHQTAQMMLRTLIRPHQKDWVDHLLDIEFAYYTSVHPAIGVTPFELHDGGRKGRIFANILLPRGADIDVGCSPASTRKYRELLAKARANMRKAQVNMQQQANRHRIPCSQP